MYFFSTQVLEVFYRWTSRDKKKSWVAVNLKYPGISKTRIPGSQKLESRRQLVSKNVVTGISENRYGYLKFYLESKYLKESDAKLICGVEN